MRNVVLEAPNLEIVSSSRNFINELLGFWRGAVNDKCGPGGSKARNI